MSASMIYIHLLPPLAIRFTILAHLRALVRLRAEPAQWQEGRPGTAAYSARSAGPAGVSQLARYVQYGVLNIQYILR